MENEGNNPIFVPIAENQQQEKQTAGVYESLVQEERVSNFISQTSPSKSLEAINYMLRGYMYDNKAKDWIQVSIGIPDEIRLDFLQMLTPHLSEDARMTNLQEQQINNMMEFIIEWVTDYLVCVSDTHDLTEEQMTKIGLILLSAVFYTILRARSGIERQEIFRSLSMGEQLHPQALDKPSGEAWWKFWK